MPTLWRETRPAREDHDDSHWRGRTATALRGHLTPRSLHLTMRDGVKIAIDVYAPRVKRGPTIIRQTRYLRGLEARRPLGRSGFTSLFDLYERTRRVFLAAGYGWVDVDVRGTGASSGSWICPWSPDEVRDGGEVVDWIVRQPWSNGAVGSLGTSYDGTCADMLLVNAHPAVRAIAPMYALYDVYTDVAFPGGIHLRWFTERWAEYNAALDRGRFDEGMPLTLWLLARAGALSPDEGLAKRAFSFATRKDEQAFRARVSPILGAMVRGVRSAPEVFDAAREHNMDVHEIAKRVTFRDDVGGVAAMPEATVDVFSPHAYRDEVASSGAAIYSYSGWRDGAYPHSAIKRFSTVKNAGSRLILGPWVHTGKLAVLPFGGARKTRFDHDAELLAFFDAELEGKPLEDEPVHYYTMVEGRWKSASRWPPEAEMQALHLTGERKLAAVAPMYRGSLRHRDEGAGTGERSRWRSLLSLVPGDYPDRNPRDEGLLCFDGDPLEHDLEVTGHPVATLYVSFPEPAAGHVFVYLEDIAPDGHVAYVTEGQLRALHRKVGPAGYESPAPGHSFRSADALPLAPGEVAAMLVDLLPISWLFRRGHRVRLAIAGADVDHFESQAPVTMHVHHGGEHASRIELPVVHSRR